MKNVIAIASLCVTLAGIALAQKEPHEGKEFYGWSCKNLAPYNTNRQFTAELTGPLKATKQMVVLVLWHEPDEAVWRGGLRRSMYLGGPNKGKLMENDWESHFTNGVKESHLQLGRMQTAHSAPTATLDGSSISGLTYPNRTTRPN